MKSIMKRVLSGEWSTIQNDVEKMVADKVKAKVDDARINVLAKLNGTTPEKQAEMLNVSK